jgi:hypothetical protein
VLYEQIGGNRKARDGSKRNAEARADAPSKTQRAREQSRVFDTSLPDTDLPMHTAVDVSIW